MSAEVEVPNLAFLKKHFGQFLNNLTHRITTFLVSRCRRCRNHSMFVGYSGFMLKYSIGSPEKSWKRDLILPLLIFIFFCIDIKDQL